MPVPDSSVDAIVTDPPYFDFVHYSELSDFFYAWLTNALGSEYEYLNRPNSSHENEVQDRDHESFKRKICSIFQECNRVLKEDGLLCFSYHHSTIEGWMAIYNSVTEAGFDIVASHPVKAEMSVARPKSTTKNPINIDSILICKKEKKPPIIKNPDVEVLTRIINLLERFTTVNRKLSQSDMFVIICSQAITVASTLRLDGMEAEKFVRSTLESCSNKVAALG